jgi:hypothetical protein
MSGNVEFQPTMCKQAFRLCASKGFNSTALAEFFGTSRRAIYNWKQKYPEFAEAIVRGVEIWDGEMVETAEASLLRRAEGFSVPYKKTTKKDGKVYRVETGETYYPPDMSAIEMILTRRASGRWPNTQQLEVSGNPNRPLNIIHFNVPAGVESAGADSPRAAAAAESANS